ncbi:MAG: hypothetical protein JSW38_00510, partial [Dehalococcoidia bacterium]
HPDPSVMAIQADLAQHYANLLFSHTPILTLTCSITAVKFYHIVENRSNASPKRYQRTTALMCINPCIVLDS